LNPRSFRRGIVTPGLLRDFGALESARPIVGLPWMTTAATRGFSMRSFGVCSPTTGDLLPRALGIEVQPVECLHGDATGHRVAESAQRGVVAVAAVAEAAFSDDSRTVSKSPPTCSQH
jgi:hypothetical protein